jgi:diacylglycerol kinase
MPYLRDRKNALYYALRGIWQSFARETHMQLHAASMGLVIFAAIYFHVSRTEWVALLACITLVLVTEIVNTAIEKICDQITLERREEIKYIKDISAGAVMLSCIFAAIVGCLVFIPYLQKIFLS